MSHIPFNKPYLTGKEIDYIYQAVQSGKISGDGMFTKKCHDFFEKKYGFRKCLLTSSCTDALEMAAILLNIKEGDEVIMPSYTFVSTATAFVLRGANIIFCDSRKDHPGMDEDQIESLITKRTKAIVPVHYGGVACDMDKIMAIAEKHGLYVVEDAAQCVESYYTGKDGIRKPLGSIGHMAAFSFHETKNIQSGEGGMLVVNDPQFAERAEVIREKGTNRSKFFRGEVDKYGWCDIGSSFLPSDIIAAFLYAQLENVEDIQKKRISIWNKYLELLSPMKDRFSMPVIPAYASNNAHMFYLVCHGLAERTEIIEHLKKNGVNSVYHYLSLHKSPFYESKYHGKELPETDRYTDCLFRLPMFYELTDADINKVVTTLNNK